MHTRPIQMRRSRGTQTARRARPAILDDATSDGDVAIRTEDAPRELRRFPPEHVVSGFPEERLIQIDVNGCLAGAVHAIPDAPRELAVGWSFMHRFFEATDQLGHITDGGDRISIMVDGGEDLDRLRLEAVGWQAPRPARTFASFPHREDPLALDDRNLIRLADKAYEQFRNDGAPAGYIHAAVASANVIHCVARDVHIEHAVAKVIGWTLLEGRDLDTRVLIVRGVVGHRIVRTAARCGMALIISDAIPTATAVREAEQASMTVIGLVTSCQPGLFVDGGHVVEAEASDPSFGQAD